MKEPVRFTHEIGIDVEPPGDSRAGHVKVSLRGGLEYADAAEEGKENPAGREFRQSGQRIARPAAAVYRFGRQGVRRSRQPALHRALRAQHLLRSQRHLLTCNIS